MSTQSAMEKSSSLRASQFVAGSTAQFDKWLQANSDSLDSGFFEALKDLYLEKLRAGSDDARLLFARFDALPELGLDARASAFVQWLYAVDAYFHGSPQDAYRFYLKAKEFIASSNDYVSQIKLINSTILAAISSGFLREAETCFHEAEAIIAASKISGDDRQHLAPLYKSYALLQDHIGDHHRAGKYLQLASELADEFQMSELLVYIRTNQAYSMALTGQLKEALNLFLTNLDDAQETGLAYAEAKTNMHLGAVYTLLGQPANALSRYQLARSQFVELDMPSDVVTVQLLEGELFERIGALSQSLTSYQVAHAQAKLLDASFDVGDSLLRMATIYRRMGEAHLAEKLLFDSLELWRRMGQYEYRTRTQVEIGLLESGKGNLLAALQMLMEIDEGLEEDNVLQLDLKLALGHVYRSLSCLEQSNGYKDKASQYYKESISIAEKRSDRVHLRQAMVGMAEHLLHWDTSSAAQYFESAARLDDAIRQELSVQELKASYQESTSQILPQLAIIALQQDRPTDALNYVWRAKGSALLDLVYSNLSADRVAQNVREINQVRQELSALRWQLASTAADDLAPSTTEKIQTQIHELQQKLYELRRQRNEASEADWDLSTVTIKDLLVAKDADLLIEYIAVGDNIFAFVANKEGWVYADLAANLDLVLELQEELHLTFQNFLLLPKTIQREERSLWEEEYLPLLSALSKLLIPIDLTGHVHEKILIAPCAPLHTIPFSALRVNESFLIESYDLVVTPTTALGCIPHDTGTDTTNTILVGSSSEQMLQAVHAEISAIENLVDDAVCYVDQPDTTKALFNLECPPSTLHIAAHAQIDTESPILSYLELQNELLTIEQIYDLRLKDTDLVTLSACNTASNMDTGGALLAFQSAFLIAGARSVLCSLWPVDDSATSWWMSKFYGSYQVENRPELSIAKSQRHMLEHSDYYHPAFWAAFSCISR